MDSGCIFSPSLTQVPSSLLNFLYTLGWAPASPGASKKSTHPRAAFATSVQRCWSKLFSSRPAQPHYSALVHFRALAPASDRRGVARSLSTLRFTSLIAQPHPTLARTHAARRSNARVACAAQRKARFGCSLLRDPTEMVYFQLASREPTAEPHSLYPILGKVRVPPPCQLWQVPGD